MNRTHSGFSLIEVIISAALVATTVGGLFAVTSMATRLTVLGQDRTIASQYAREGIEAVRQIRDANSLSNNCDASVPLPPGKLDCHDWRSGLLTNAEIAQQDSGTISLRIKKVNQDATRGFVLEEFPLVNGNNKPCAQREDLADGIYCRRMIIEPAERAKVALLEDLPQSLTDEDIRKNVLIVRSQVAWVGNGRTALREAGEIADNPACDPTSSEWCTEQVMLLTNWRVKQ